MNFTDKGFKPILWDDIDIASATKIPLLRCGIKTCQKRADGSACKWPMKRVTTSQRVEPLRPLESALERKAWLEACKLWNKACGIQLVWTDEFNRANIYAKPGSMGSGTLAWSYLPCGADEDDRMEQQYNSSVRWSYPLLMDTMAHEIGHAIGLDHSSSDGDIMRPYSNGQLGVLGKGDIREVVSRYDEYDGIDDPGGPIDEDLFSQFELRVGSKMFDCLLVGQAQ